MPLMQVGENLMNMPMLPGGEEEAQGEVEGHRGDQLLRGGRQRRRERLRRRRWKRGRPPPRNLLPHDPAAHGGQLEGRPRRRRLGGKCQDKERLEVAPGRRGGRGQLATLIIYLKASLENFMHGT